MKYAKHLVPVLLGFGLMLSMNTGAAGAGKPKDVCIAAPTGGGGFNTFVLKEVETLSPGTAAALRGFYFTTGGQKIGPLQGTAAMGSDGQIRIGLFVHYTAENAALLNDFTVSGLIDAGYNGTVGFDNDGDFKINGTLDFQRVDCSTTVIP